MKLRFKNREEVGILLAKELKNMVDDNAIVLGLARGGVPIGAIIAQHLGLDFNVYISKKIPHPENEEFAIGAIGEFGEVVINPVFSNIVTDEYILSVKNKINDYIAKYRKKPLPDLSFKSIILVDDGIATGLSMLAAIKDLQKFNPKKIIVAVGPIAQDTFDKLNKLATVVALIVSNDPFFSVGMFYDDFHQLSEEDVLDCLSK